MMNRAQRTMKPQLNSWIVARFIAEVYTRNNLSSLPEFVAHDCQYYQEHTIIGENVYELQTHFAYTWINQQSVFEEVEYEIEEILSQKDIVSVKIRRRGVNKPDTDIIPEASRWEMFQLDEGKIVQRWTANV